MSSLPAFNGFAADRNQVTINGMLISPACPNQMNPPLSFVNPSMIAFGLGLSLVMGILGGLYPAWRASHLPIMEVIRKGRSDGSTHGGGRMIVARNIRWIQPSAM